MESAAHSPAHLISSEKDEQNVSALFSDQSVLDILRMILAGAPLAEVLTIIAQLVEARGDGTLCTIWLPNKDGSQLHCAAAPSLPGFIAGAGSMLIGPKGGSCGTAVYRREPVYVTDILTDPVWDVYRDRLSPFGIRAVWSRPLFTNEGNILGTFAIHYRDQASVANANNNSRKVRSALVEKGQNHELVDQDTRKNASLPGRRR
jgi:formate hydrogenlyase transcriptional activator